MTDKICSCPSEWRNGEITKAFTDIECPVHSQMVPARHLVHCNASAMTPIGTGICICLHELRNTIPTS